MTQDMNYTFVKALRAVLVVMLMLLTGSNGLAQTTTQTGVRVNGSVYGGGNAADVGANATVNITHGTVSGSVYGGGFGETTVVTGNVLVNIGKKEPTSEGITLSGDATITGDVYGGSAKGKVNATKGGTVSEPTYSGTDNTTTQVNIYSTSTTGIGGNVYGGGLGQYSDDNNDANDFAADVYGNVTVNIGATNGATSNPTYYGNATIGGSIFGCNNANGSPQGDVVVNIYKTAHTTTEVNNQYPSEVTELDEFSALSSTDDQFAIKAVYGGGNKAGYTPPSTGTTTPHSTTVHVYGCDENTVKSVYGGGNAADVGTTGTSGVSANTNVIIDGGRFLYVFGGGNGEGIGNPGANIYGTATTEIKGGLLNQVFGGSNSKGDVDNVDFSIKSECTTLLVNESFGGANFSPITGDVITTLTCDANTKVGNFYGGSNQADITGSVTLNVYGGEFTNVFGGSKGVADDPTTTENEAVSADITGDVTLNLYGGTMTNAYGGSDVNGAINGKITVNVLNNGGTCALQVTNIYGGGNLTPYEPTYTPSSGTERISPVVNFIHGSSLNVFGGAKGSTATVTSSPQVNIGYDETTMGNLTTENTLLYNLTRDDTNYKSATATAPANFAAIITGNVYGGGDEAQVTGNTTVYLRKTNSSVGSLFGGGNMADVSGNTVVNINAGTVTDVYGGGALANVGTVADNTTQVTVAGGTVGTVYGGGLGRIKTDAVNYTQDEADAYNTANNLNSGDSGFVTTETVKTPGVSAVAALVNGAVTVTVNGGTVTNVFGCNNQNGSPQSTVQVDINSSVSGSVYGGGNLASYTAPEATTTNTTAHDYPIVNIKNGTISGSVFGGGYGSTAIVTGNPTVTIGDNTSNTTYAIVTGNVYGGGDAAKVVGNTTVIYNDTHTSSQVANLFGGSNAANIEVNSQISGTGKTNVTLTNGKVTSGVYGGCNTSGTVGGDITIGLTGGTVGAAAVGTSGQPGYVAEQRANVFGGGYGHSTSTSGNIGITLNGTTIYGDLYGGSALGNVNGSAEHTTTLTISSNTLHGTIYGGGQGSGSDADGKAISNGNVQIDYNVANTNLTGLYGGANINGNVAGNISLNVKADVGQDATHTCDIYGGGLGSATATGGTVTVTIDEDSNPTIYGDIYGGSAFGQVSAANKLTMVDFQKGTLNGTIYGGGKGQTSAPVYTAIVNGNVQVNVADGSISGGVYGGCNAKGNVVGNITMNLTGGQVGASGSGNKADVFGGGFGNGTTTSGNIGIILNGTTIIGDLYGGSAMGSVNGSTEHTTTLTISSNTLHGTIYGGGQGDVAVEGDNTHSNVTAISNGNVLINYNTENTSLEGLFGGANINGLVKGAIAVNVKANVGSSTSTLNIFGGGYGANTNTEGNVTVTIGDVEGTSTPIIYGDIYGGSALGNVNNEATDITKIDFLNGTLKKTTISGVDHGGNIYGGGLGDKASLATTQDPDHADVAAKVNGKVMVNISSNDQDDDDCKIDLRGVNIYGCNNTNGSPQADVEVHIYKTAYNYTDYTSGDDYTAANGAYPYYAIDQVFGGGNQADYLPENGDENSTKKAKVYVHACNNTIRRVFGGGNAAAATGVANEIDGGRFDFVYGGGNGESSPANIGKGGTDLQIHGGNINTLFGGSNTSGTITGNMGISIDGTGCATDMYIEKFFCGNNLANIGTQSNPVNINATIGCGTNFGDVYGGCKQADIYGNVTLTIEGGTFKNVYGGSEGINPAANATDDEKAAAAADINGNVILNLYGGNIAQNAYGGSNINGNITGSITVNMDWSQASSSCNNTGDLHVTNVYGASNLAAYTPTNPSGNYPEVNIKHGIVSGSVFGGGKGGSAIVTSNPKVTIGDNVAEHYAVVSENVYGGGDAAAVIGNTSVTYSDTNTSSTVANVFGGGNAAGVSGSTSVNLTAGKVTTAMYGGCNTSGTIGGTSTVNVTGGTIGTAFAAPTSMVGIPQVLFGGGKGKETVVTGKTTLNVGTKTETTYAGTADIYGNVYGGSENGTIGDVDVNLYGNNIYGNVFGGGFDTDASLATGTTLAKHAPAAQAVNVLLDGTEFKRTGTYANNEYMAQIFGCNNKNGTPKGLVTVNVKRTKGSEKDGTTPVASRTTFDVAAVYGGGNQADYVPTNATDSTFVLIEGCDLTSIQYVYGGGNAAAVPATGVSVKGTYIIDKVFGGGNGAGSGNPGANVGAYINGTNKQQYEGSKGSAVTKLYGGTINSVFGGSNTLGDIRKVIVETKSKETGDETPGCCTTLDVANLYGAGSKAEVNGDVNIILECLTDDYVDAVYGGAEEAIINGNVSLTVTSGKFGRVFGGNNKGGSINGTVKVYVKEEGCKDLEIGELYGAGNNAPYSKYGCYYDENETDETKRWKAYDNKSAANKNFEVSFDRNNDGINDEEPYHVKVFVEACTSIGKIFGGGKGETATVTGDTYVNVNMMYGSVNNTPKTEIGRIGQVYGGGNAGEVTGNTTIDIGTATAASGQSIGAKIKAGVYIDPNATEYGTLTIPATEADVYGGGMNAKVNGNTTVNIGTAVQDLGVSIDGNVFGGGKEGDVTGYTQVNICAKKKDDGTYEATTPSTAGVNITGNVYGGGKGVASESGDRAFYCEAAMVGDNNTNSVENNDNPAYANYGTHVRIGNGTVNGSVYGGGEIGRVEYHTEVIIGLGNGTGSDTKSPVIYGSVFGAGKGTNTHGYSGLVRGDSKVTIQGDAKVGHSVYGGGEMASIGKYDVVNGLPKTPVFGGKCTVTIQGYAEIGPNGMKMDNSSTTGKPDDTGHVFGAGKGILPYENVTGSPWSMQPGGKVTYDENNYVVGEDRLSYEAAYYKFIQSLGLASNTDVTIGGHAFIKGSVYGGSENGYVQANTHVTIAAGQIGVGQGETTPYDGNAFIDLSDPSTTTVTTENALKTCATWPYDKVTTGKPYDKYATYLKDGEYYYDDGYTKSSMGGAPVATDGHTYYGNVFGGGRGVVPFAAGKWHRAAGSVGGNTQVDIIDGHILSSVYGGNENTDVGSYELGSDGEPTTTLEKGGTCTINISGGTIGVPRTKEQIDNNPVIGNVFGAGKGDKRVLFNTWTNVGATSVNISGTAKIYGSVFGGGEDGHVINNAVTNIGGTVTTGVVGNTTDHAYSKVVIGSTGISGADGNVFGGGRGSETALTAGVVGGNVNLTVDNGYVLGNVYGGGRLASVGMNFTNPTLANGDPDPHYGQLQDGDTHGNITVTINGGTIGTNSSTGISGNIYGGSKGTTTDFRLGIVRSTTINITDGTAYASVYGGGELAQVVESHTTDGKAWGSEINISGGTIGISGKGGAALGNVYGGGKGNTTHLEAGLINSNTKVNISQAEGKTTTIYHNIYGGGAYGSVGTYTYNTDGNGKLTEISGYTSGGKAEIYITGGTIGTTGKENGMVFGSSRGDVGDPNSIHNKLAWVYDTHVAIGDTIATTTTTATPLIKGSVYGGGENGHNYRNAYVRINGGTIGIANSSDPNYSVTSDGTTYNGAEYPYRGNVYGGGCGTDKYYQDPNQETHDGNGQLYNPKAGIVQGNAIVHISAGNIVRNVYGAGAMGSVGKFEKNATTNAITFTSGGKTTIEISGGTIGVDGTAGDGNVFGAARGDKAFTDKDLALVKETGVTISGSTSATQIKGNVYGGGEVGNVHTNTAVTVQGGAIAKNVFGGGKGVGDLFTCEQAMVGVDGEGAGANLDADVNKDKGTIVTITNGTVGTLNEGALVEGTGNVYGGGEIGRVEWNAQVIIGSATETSTPVIHGNVFGAGKGLETHGYSALVRGNSTVTVQGGAKVGHCVYGGGENSTVGRYWVKGINNSAAGAPAAPEDLPDGMPYQQQSGGICRVTIQGNAVIGGDNNADLYTGHVFGAGRGVVPHFNAGTTDRMVNDGNGGSLVAFADKTDATTGEVVKTAEELYLEFLQTLSLATNAYVTIDGSAHVKGSVFGGSESGFVQTNTDVRILNGTIGTPASYGNVFGGGRGLEAFAEAGKVKGTTEVTISGGTAYGNVYGGGNLGDVGIITKNTTDYNYTWNQSDGVTVNAHYNNTITDTNTNTGICKVTIAGGTIGVENTAEPTKHGNVFGAGRGLADTWWCEKAIAYATNVTVNKGTVYGNVYGGGEVGRVEDDAKVTIGALNGTDVFEIKGSVFGAGAGLATHGYSALVRGNAEVTVQGKAQVGGSVYGGGEIASVGRFHVVGGLPRNPQAGGTCTVKIQGNAKIGTSGTGHNVFGACKGVTPVYNSSNYKSVYSMQLYENRPSGSAGDTWDYYTTYDEGYTGQKFIKRYYKTEQDYIDFLKTLALTSNTHVTIGGSSHVYGSVYGGGERGITLGGVDVNMTGGTVYEDVYGGGSLADSNTAMWDATNNTLHDYAELELIPGLSVVTGYYTDKSPETLIAEEDKKADGTKYYAIYKTNVNLKGGTIIGDAYGGGLGQKKYLEAGETGYVSPIEAMVYGDVTVKLNEGLAGSAKGCAVNRVFGCNNLNGTPKGKVQVYVYATQKSGGENLADKATLNSGSYDVQAVYGGGNLAKYEPVDALLEYNETNKATVDAARPEVYIDGCLLTSIKQVYGGGNAAPVPATYVEINSAYEIDEAFGGGNGKDGYSLKEGNEPVYYENPGANVGYYTYADYPKTSGQGTGSEADPYKAVQDPRYDETDPEGIGTRQARLNATDIQYGSGVATLVVTGGTIHSSYGGSNLRGNVRVRLSSRYSAMNDECPMAVGTSYGGGNKAFSDGSVDMVADCAKGVTEMFGGSKNADFDGDINMLITNGSSLQRVFGGNNTSGAVNGSITITIKEGGCEPIRIGELYAGGFLAPYSVYGYKKDTNGNYLTENVSYVDADGNQQTQEQRIPLTAEDVDENFVPKANPRINVISATYIGNIFGGGYQAKLVGDPHINVNMEPGRILASYHPEVGDKTDYSGQTYTVESIEESSGDGILSTGTIGNIYGGGNLADIVGDTYVEIGTGKWVKLDADGNEVEETLTRNAANITGNVFGGGKGKDDTFQCEKGMVGVNGDGIDHPEGGTYITIGNGTIEGNVYGGGEIGRVEKNTMVTIGLAADDVPEGLTSSPVIEGSVFGGGKGKETHGYAALVRGNPTVIIQGNAKVGHNVYGGGEIASVARYQVVNGVPVALAQVKEGQHSGYCTVIVKDNAEIGPDGMKMYHSDITDGSDKPDDWGHVFGAGKGFLPDNYTYENNDNRPKRMMAYDSEKYNASNSEYWEYSDTEHQNVWEYFPNRDKYIEFIQTQALATHTDVTIEGNAFVKGSVYGGSENGLVQYDTDVKITGNCQIGEGEGKNGRYTDGDWAKESLAGCAHWDFYELSGAPYDPYAKYLNKADGKYYYDARFTKYAEGGSNIAKDGHTYYGNVFGGGSGSVPYFDTTEGRSVYLNSAGTVKGNTKVTISGGHILTSVYGGCESTNVLGTSTVTMTAGTIGVPRTVKQIQAHPVICNLFGAGKGDQRVFFNKDTNVENAVVNVSGTAKIYGSVFGGGEDGHVLRNSKVTIGDGAVIGAFGYSGYDGNVFGGGRGFGGDALTAGNVSGDVEVNINGGSVLGSVYGGGRLASVGYGLYKTTEAGYGEMKDDGKDDAGNSVEGFTRGHVKVNITDGTIGNDTESTLTHTKGGNVFGGSMGRLTLLNGTTNPIWPKLARVKAAEVNIKGGTVKANVYGGGEQGTVHTTSKVTVNKGTVNGNVFGGGYGSNDNVTKTEMDGVTYSAVQIAGRVDGTTTVEMNDGQVKKNLYGGGEMASVGVFTVSDDMRTFTWGTPTDWNNTGVCNVTVTGGTIGTTGSSNTGHVFGAGKGLEDTFWCEKGIVYSTNVNISKGTVNGNVYGGGEVGRVETNAIVTVEGTADIKGNVFGAGAGKETHGYSALVRGNTTVTVQGSAAVGKSVYGGGEIASVGRYALDAQKMPSILQGGGYCYVTVQGNATVGADVFGAGEGVKSHFNNTADDHSKRSRRMTVYNATDFPESTGPEGTGAWEYCETYSSDYSGTKFVWDYLQNESAYSTYLETLALATHPEVTIDGSASIGKSVYGGGELGLTKGSVIVNIKGGTITEDVYGGGSLANTNTTSSVDTDNDGTADKTVHPTTTVNLLGGTVTRNVYGGGLGQKEVKTGETVTTPGIEAIVYGDVNVNLNGTTTVTTDAAGNKTYTPSPNDPTKKGCVVKGNIFGANNVNGTPKGHVLVYVHGTQNETTSALNAKVDGLYDVTGVFGGGNASDYVPDEADTKQSTEVIIEGCDLTSIDEVYGGGYGAATPATSVLVKGTKIINNVYGGGYGASTDTYTNPGANVGYRSDKALYAQGTGKAIVQLMAGTVNNVYGGSNTLGDIRGGSSVTNVANDGSAGCCEKLKVGEIYGGGKQADMYGGAEIILGCMPDDWIGAIYAGAENANVGNDVSLTLTSGKFGRVFGGNKSGGTIDGYIEVNIEENPECSTPIIIGGLYGGGNEAPYTVPARYFTNNPNYLSPRVNVRAFTSIGNIYGGGFGATATVTGNPLVNINVVEGGREYAGEDKPLEDGTTVTLHARSKDAKMGVIGNVFGGGNAAKVIGNTNVMIGTEAEQEMESLRTTDATTGTVTVVKKPVLGADIQGNVYGAGNNADVTGNTNVVIGKEATTTTTTPEP